MKITDETGFITDKATRNAYERICNAPGWPHNRYQQQRSAESFLKLCERVAANNPDLFRKLLPEN